MIHEICSDHGEDMQSIPPPPVFFLVKTEEQVDLCKPRAHVLQSHFD